MRRFTFSEAVDAMSTVFDVEAEMMTIGLDRTGLVEAFVYDMDVSEARAAMDGYFAITPSSIDPDSIEYHPDHVDGDDTAAVRIVIKTGELG
jgi:hypothetical protein